jgi:hypothetical protein
MNVTIHAVFCFSTERSPMLLRRGLGWRIHEQKDFARAIHFCGFAVRFEFAGCCSAD